MFFRWVWQHLRIKAFFGISENAVKTQIWITVSVSDALPLPDIIAAEIAEELEAAFELFSKIARKLPKSKV